MNQTTRKQSPCIPYSFILKGNCCCCSVRASSRETEKPPVQTVKEHNRPLPQRNFNSFKGSKHLLWLPPRLLFKDLLQNIPTRKLVSVVCMRALEKLNWMLLWLKARVFL
ncbi:hypothetical protein BaRGS_00023819 [Batillaria attramentaria]|uniref:Uncharacterized protein n=1 Tax=Batillaria attramentaria TaxID=370345 RepID=A0ABD0KCN5_9CAEN